LPETVIDRKQHGVSVPLSRWFRGDLSSFMRDVLLSDTSRQRGIFEKSYVEQLLKRNADGHNLERELWTLVSFELWCRAVLDGRPGLRGAGARGRTSTLTEPVFARR
jgi:asparagine synthase (glutamine-hydrolysing)